MSANWAAGMEAPKTRGGLPGALALAALCSLGCGDNVADASREPPPSSGSGGRSSGTGGAPAIGCDVPLEDRVAVTTVTALTEVLANTEFFPVVLAPRDSGGSLVAWREAPTQTIRVAELDGGDQLVGTVLTLPGIEVHALVAHDDGGAVAIVDEDPSISGSACRPAEHPDWWCGKVDLVRFGEAGNTEWRSTLTSGTDVDSDDALFIYWYEHTVRLGWSGQEYGVYFRSAGSIASAIPGEVEIPSGDVFRFVSGDGSSVEGGWSWGCSYSWSVRLAYNGHWGAACHGDDIPNALRLQIMDPGDPGRFLGTAILHEGMDPTRRALGGLVPTSNGFWLSHIAEDEDSVLQLHLADIDNSAAIGEDRVIPEAQSIDDSYPFRPYMAEYAGDQLLVGWKSDGELQIATLDGFTGELLDGPVTVTAGIDQFQEFVSHPNGDVGWAWSPGGTDEVSVVRVRACE